MNGPPRVPSFEGRGVVRPLKHRFLPDPARRAFLAVVAVLSLSISGCGAVPALISATSVGVEYGMYSVVNKAGGVYPVKSGPVREAVDRTVKQLKLKVVERWRDQGAGRYLLHAATDRNKIEITVEPVTPKVTRLIVNAYRKNFVILKDKALARAVVRQAEKEMQEAGAERAAK